VKAPPGGYGTIELDLMAAHGCSNPDCDHKGHDGRIFLHGSCHPNAPVEVSYDRGGGRLTVACYQRKKLIAHVRVAT